LTNTLKGKGPDMLLLDRSARRNATPMASYMEDIGEADLLKQEEEHDLARRIQQGDMEARDQMVRANLRLVVSIARRFDSRGLCLSDLIQEGNLGLVHAVERFDPSQNTRFSTYAKYWIQEAMGKALERSTGPVRVPGYANDLLTDWRNAANDLHKELGRAPSDEEVAGRLQLSQRQLAIVRKARRILNNVSSISSQDDTATRALIDLDYQGPDAGLTADDEMRRVLELLDELPDRDATILRLRFGLSGQNPLTMIEIGQQLT